jgi:hypothetical protein
MTLEQADTPSKNNIRAQHEDLARVLRGEQPMGWTEWAMHFHESSCLTPMGRNVAQWAVETLQRFLGGNFLQRAAGQHPIFSFDLWPENDVPRVFANLFQLASQITLLGDRVKPLRKIMRQNLDTPSWTHSLLQLEVASLGLRAGWTSTFEPDLPNGGRADLHLEAGSATLLVEIASMGFSDPERQALAFDREVFWKIRGIEMHHAVQILGSIGEVTSQTNIDRWIDDIEVAAIATARDGSPHNVRGPNGGVVQVTRDSLALEPVRLEGSPVITDTWSRLAARINEKARQTADSGPVWLRLEDQAGIWFFTPIQNMSLSEKLATLGLALREAIDPFPHLAGIILSPGVMLAGKVIQAEICEMSVLESPAAALRYPLPTHRFRESIILARTEKPDAGYATFVDWYRHETTWLDWALEQLGFPSLSTLAFDP